LTVTIGGKAPSAKRALERAQPVAAEGVQRAEVAGERAGSAIGADERAERDLTDAQVPAPERLQSPLDLVELEPAVIAAGPQSLHLEIKRTTSVRVADFTQHRPLLFTRGRFGSRRARPHEWLLRLASACLPADRRKDWTRMAIDRNRRFGGISLGGIVVIVGVVVALIWSFWLGIIIALVGLIAFGGFVRGKWY
jgi:hypothetical protein